MYETIKLSTEYNFQMINYGDYQLRDTLNFISNISGHLIIFYYKNKTFQILMVREF